MISIIIRCLMEKVKSSNLKEKEKSIDLVCMNNLQWLIQVAESPDSKTLFLITTNLSEKAMAISHCPF